MAPITRKAASNFKQAKEARQQKAPNKPQPLQQPTLPYRPTHLTVKQIKEAIDKVVAA